MLRPPLFATFVILLLFGRWLVPAAETAWRLAAAGNDPVAIGDVLVARTTNAPAMAAEIDRALAEKDADLADSLLALADRSAIPVDDARRKAVAEATRGSILQDGGNFLRGAVIGDAGGGTGLAGALAGDLVGIGDLRDLGRESWHFAKGEEPDRLVMGLAAAGLAVTAATWISAGEAAPVRGGLTLVKALRKAGRLSASMTESLGRLVRRAVDFDSLAKASRSLARLDLASAREAAKASIRPASLAPLAAMGRDTATLFRRAGTRAVEDAMGLARSPGEISRFARFSEGFGRATRGALKILGRTILLAGESLAVIAGWLVTAGLYVLALAMAAARLGRRLAGIGRPRRRLARRSLPGSGRGHSPFERPEPRLDWPRNPADHRALDDFALQAAEPKDPGHSRSQQDRGRPRNVFAPHPMKIATAAIG